MDHKPQKGEDNTCYLFICTKCTDAHIVDAKKSFLNTKDNNSELMHV